jgi:hypothetical protein
VATYSDAAALVTERGWPVFPLVEGEKTPLTPRGFHDATLDLDLVRRWWAKWPNANVGVPTGVASGIVVVDVDDLSALDLLPDLPSTLRLATGNGLHCVFEHPGFEVRNSASKIAPGIDIRGDGGYVVAPGSTHPNGKPYVVLDPSPIAELPGWLAGRLRGDRPERVETPSASGGALSGSVLPAGHPSMDTPYGLAALDAEIGALRLAGEGTRNDALNRAAFALFGLVKGGELTPGVAHESLEVAARALGLGEREIGKTLRSAWLSAEPRSAPESPTNADEARLLAELVGGAQAGTETVSRDVETEPERAVDLLRAKLLSVAMVLDLPAPEALIDGYLMRNTIACLYGKPGSRKTFLALDWSLCIASGTYWKGAEVAPGRVLFVAAEGVAGLGKRVSSWSEANNVRTFEHGIDFLPQSIPLLGLDAVVLVEELVRENDYALVVVDTLARCMVGGDENSAQDMGRAVDALERIRRASSATVLPLHHDTKDGGTPRGSSALHGAVDTLVQTIAEGDRTLIRVEKQKDSEAAPDFALYARSYGESIALDRVPETTTDPRSALLESFVALREVEGKSGVTRTIWRKAAAEHGVSESTHYRHVGTLEEEGKVTGSGRGSARIFRTTEEGRSWGAGSA